MQTGPIMQSGPIMTRMPRRTRPGRAIPPGRRSLCGSVRAGPRAPYPHAREVLALRAELEGTALLVGGWSWTAEAAALVASGWARPLEADRVERRRTWPRVALAADGPADPP